MKSMRYLIRNMLCAGWLAVSLAHAQRVPGTDMPPGFESIPPSGSKCRSEEPAAKATPPQAPAKETANFDCALDADKLQAMLSSPDTMLADLRPSSAFATFHITPAVNISGSDLANKSYWRDKRLVLVGDGKGEHDLYIQCARLKRSGYKHVYVLRGGIAQWYARELPLYGRAPTLATQIRLSAAELWQETRNPRNFIVLDAGLAGLASAVSATRTIPAPTPEAIAGAFRARDRRTAGGAAIVLATSARLDDARIKELMRAVHPAPLLVYSGSADEYRKQLAQQQAVWKAHEQGPRTLPCGS